MESELGVHGSPVLPHLPRGAGQSWKGFKRNRLVGCWLGLKRTPFWGLMKHHRV